MRRRRNAADEEIRKAWRALVAGGGDDLAAVEEYLGLLKRHEDPAAKESEKKREDRELDEARNRLRQNYFDSVRSHVESIMDDIRSGHLTDRDRLMDRVTEESYSSYWATYTAASQQALLASENADYGTDEGLVAVNEREGIPWGSLAAWAFYRDMLDELGNEIDLNDDSEWPTPENLERQRLEAEADEVGEEDVE